jgi:hypothetical protein
LKKDLELKAIVATGLVFAALTTLITETAVTVPGSTANALFMMKLFLTSFNIIILSGLVVNYLKIYREIPTSTSRSLLIFSAALTLYAVSANPLLHIIFGFNVISVGPFTYLPDLFVAAASVSLLRESYK